MARTLIRTRRLPNSDGDSDVILSIDEPVNVPHRDEVRIMSADLTMPPFSDLAAVPASYRAQLAGGLVRLTGEKVLEVLCEHPGIAHAIDQSVSAPGADISPIFIETRASEAEAMPWELLYHPAGEFLTLDPRWPIVRITNDDGLTPERHYAQPLRITLVLGSIQPSSIPEWDVIYAALQSSGIAYELTLFCAEAQLRQHVQALDDPQIDIRPVPQSADALITELKAVKPQLLHFFCHGIANTRGYLEIATANHLAMGDEPLYVTPKEIGQLQELVWLVVINACEGAAPPGELHSIAYGIVDAGVPAAIGMREPIDSLDANRFSDAFYRATFTALAAELVPGAKVTMDWTPMLRAARTALTAQSTGPAAHQAEFHKIWSLPILYQKPASLVVWCSTDDKVQASLQAEQVAELEALRQVRTTLTPDAPNVFRLQLDERIAELEDLISPVQVADVVT